MNQRGQTTIELVILLAVIMLVVTLVSKGFRENEFIAGLVAKPWQSTAGLIQNGVWGAPDQTMLKHPNQYDRVSTPEGDIVK